MCTEVNSAMGLQATAATKRKHETTFDSKDANTTYTNCPPPIKTRKWSMNNNNYIEAVEEHLSGNKVAPNSNNNITRATEETTITTTTTTNKCPANNNNIISNNNNNNESKSCSSNICSSPVNSINNGKEVTKSSDSVAAVTPLVPQPQTTVNSLVTSMIPTAAEVAATTPLPPTSTTPVPEDSIAKLEVVAAVPCEPWTTTTPEPVDCISKLQAVAVPSDPWGSISTRSTLATTLLSTDELDDDDDDFEDDYEEEESIIPTYCPLRYHPFPPASTTPHQPQQRLGTYSPTHGYGSRPNYYSEPFPQQNCSRTGSPQHMRMANGFAQQWPQGSSGNGSQQFYVPPEAAYPPQQQQQTIRCAENGKSYLELGCSSPVPTTNNTAVVPPPPFGPMHVPGTNLDARHPLKRCCDGRGTWCNTNKNCYKDIRLKIRNLSMFKLSRFRQVSEQSLYRSVLICNTLKRIDREIEAEAKEMHQAAAHAAQQHHHQQTQYHQHHHPHHLQHHPHHNHHHSQQQQQPIAPQPQPQSLLHQPHQEYSPVMNCARLANMEYQVQQQPPQLPHQPQPPPQQQQHHQQQQHFQPQHPQHYHNQPERLDTPPPTPYLSSPPQMQKSISNFAALNTISSNNCDATAAASSSSSLHPYDHYPFRESQSGRVTPFPCQPVISTPPASQASQAQSPTAMSIAAAATSTQSAAAAVNSSTAAATSTTTHINTNMLTDSDSGYADDDSTRSINWSSVLSLSSQSALDPLNNNDLFSILPPATSVTNPATAVPVPSASSPSSLIGGQHDATTQSPAVSISGTFTTVQAASSTTSAVSLHAVASSSASSLITAPSSSTTATFTTLSTISSATHSLTSSYVSSMSSNASASTWEYGFLDMEFGLGSEFTELVPSCKLSSDELFKSGLTPVAASRYSSVHDNEMEQPAHIMVGS